MKRYVGSRRPIILAKQGIEQFVIGQACVASCLLLGRHKTLHHLLIHTPVCKGFATLFVFVFVTRQAVQLGFWPRMVIQHTSAKEEGQIYLPRVNLLLCVAVMCR
ncbi:potassium uptake protein [Alcaligenes faecalis subsp. faecalis NCIB 8687]|nr:potassium uptake protein [Alcaligenes faecalis subsp. faecalis NCIB 8687]